LRPTDAGEDSIAIRADRKIPSLSKSRGIGALVTLGSEPLIAKIGFTITAFFLIGLPATIIGQFCCIDALLIGGREFSVVALKIAFP
jgi:hypothetical protein